MTTLDSDADSWLCALSSRDELGRLLAPLPRGRAAAGYGDTLTEICMQPLLWTDTARRIAGLREQWPGLEGLGWLALTGSGSSQYACDCVAPVLQAETAMPVFALAGGWLLLEGAQSVPAARPGLLVSLARSGDSPESAGVVESFLETEPAVLHLIITCNAEGKLATRFAGDPRVTVLVLDGRTNDRSLVMTGSFTNLVLASRGLGLWRCPDALETMAERLASLGKDLLLKHTGTLAAVARSRYTRVVYLASGCRFGAARESALKMLEMNAGRIPTMAETYLGVRHGPMCAIDRDTLVVCSLASEPLARAYEEDLICELNRKALGAGKLIVGEQIPPSLLTGNDVALEIPGLAALGDSNVPVLDAMVGQLLAFFRCLAGGLRPDMPSTGVISRVVNRFRIHRRDTMGLIQKNSTEIE
jgi:tagatose-6-phosphate ketose/aldose isomerase